MTAGSSNDDTLARYTLSFDAHHLVGLTFLLGNRGGFVLYLPAAHGVRDRTMQATKWSGASGFGRSFMEGLRVWVNDGGEWVELDQTNQTGFVMCLDGATRVYQVGKREIRSSFFVPDGFQTCVVTIDSDLPLRLKPEFDMRYYQAFNRDFSQYRAERETEGVLVSNTVADIGPLHAEMKFYGLVGTLEPGTDISMLPGGERLVTKTYLKDEHREKLIISVYKEAQTTDADEAPIWDAYSTQVYAPALLQTPGSVSLICAFGDTRQEAVDDFQAVKSRLDELRCRKRADVARDLSRASLETGNHEVDTAYAHVFTRFNDALVARDATLHVDPVHQQHYYAIFAGNKYFMDAWKRDENISLEALLVTNDFETARRILDDTWQHQDERTGRLPHIIRAGEPLVYYSSDGTLWALQRLFEYTCRSGDRSLLDEKMPMVEHFFSASMSFVQRGLLPSGGIIDQSYLWETWEDTPYTPRDGFPVEIELLWLTLLLEFQPVISPQNAALARQMQATLEEGQKTFKLLVHGDYLVDSISYGWQPNTILTPNGYIAFGLQYPLPPSLEHAMVMTARDQLAGHRGVRSLAPRDWAKVLPSSFLDDPHSHHGKDMESVGIFNYHRGIEWEWLNPFFVAGELTCGSTEDAYRLYVAGQVVEATREAGIGGLSELHDVRGQLGADFQAWSMAGFLDSLHLFAGVEVDALGKTVRIRPSIPREWTQVRCRSRVADTHFDVEYREPSPQTRSLRIHLVDSLPGGYRISLGFRLPPDFRITSSTCNGDSLASDAWSYRKGCSPDTPGEAWITQDWEGDITLGAEIGQE